MLQLRLKTAEQKSCVRAAEALRVTVESNADRVGLDYRATKFGVSRRQPHGNAAQVRHHDSVDPPHPRQHSGGGHCTVSNCVIQMPCSQKFRDLPVPWSSARLGVPLEEFAVQSELQESLLLTRFAQRGVFVVPGTPPRPPRVAA